MIMHEEPVARHWINGKLSQDGPRHPSVNPATSETFGYYHDADEHVATAAVSAASAAFLASEWREDAMLRATTLHRLADAYEQHTPELVETLMLENGKLRQQAAYEVHFIPRALRYAAGLAVVQAGRVHADDAGSAVDEHPSAGRCRRGHHPVELARVPVDPFDRAGARRWVLGRPEDARPGGAHRSGDGRHLLERRDPPRRAGKHLH